MLLTAGFAPEFTALSFDDAGFTPAREAVEAMITGLEPKPSFPVDRYWKLITGKASVAVLFEGVDPELLRPPVNILRLCPHPAGLAQRVINYDKWRSSIIAFLRRQVALTGDPQLMALTAEMEAYQRHQVPAADPDE